MSHTTAKDVTECLYSMFAMWGLPATVVADNGPPFNSADFNRFLTALNVTLLHSAPAHPNSNSYGGRVVQTMKHCLKKELLDEAAKSQSVSTQLRVS